MNVVFLYFEQIKYLIYSNSFLFCHWWSWKVSTNPACLSCRW